MTHACEACSGLCLECLSASVCKSCTKEYLIIKNGLCICREGFLLIGDSCLD